MVITLNNSDNVNANSNMLTKTIQNNSISTNYSRLLSNQLTTINKINHKSPIVIAAAPTPPVVNRRTSNDNFKIKIINRQFTNDDDGDDNDGGEMMDVEDEDENDQFRRPTTTKSMPVSRPNPQKPQPQVSSSSNDANLQGYKLIVSNLHPNVTQEDLMVSINQNESI